jgi:putative ABC transport system substrate-binding protein
MSIGKSSLFFVVGSFTAKPPGRQRGAPRAQFHVHWRGDWQQLNGGYDPSGLGIRLMRRRDFIMLVGGATAGWPLAALAQALAKIARVGFLGLAPASAWTGEVAALRAGLRELGYVEGKNIVLEFRWAEGVSELPLFAAEFVRMKLDIILAPASTQVEPARQATSTIPIIFAQHADPVGTGDVVSLARPGGNITGVSMVLTELAAKGLEILKQALPGATRIGVLSNPTTPSHVKVVREVEAASKTLGVQLLMTPVQTIADQFAAEASG